MGEVLGGGADHRRPADVDVLEGVVQRHAGPGHRLHEGVEIDRYQVDGVDAAPGQLVQVGGLVAAGEDAAVHRRVEGLHAAVQDLEAGELGDAGDGDAGLGQGLVGAAGAVQLEAEVGQPAGELDHACLVRDAYDGLHL